MRSSLLRSVAGSAFAAAALVFAAAGTSSAAAATVTVSPATDLTDGAAVTVSLAGFTAGQAVYSTQCAEVSAGTIACNLPDSLNLTADASGNATGQTVARKTFTATTEGGQTHSVNCTTATGGCFFWAGVDNGPNATAPIAFK